MIAALRPDARVRLLAQFDATTLLVIGMEKEAKWKLDIEKEAAHLMWCLH